jgi:sugar phosphate isomerase/epimerase
MAYPLYLAPTTVMDAGPIELIDVAFGAGYDGIGIRLYASPHLPFHPVVGNAPLIESIRRALASSRLGVLDIYTYYLQPDTRLADFEPSLRLGAELGARYAVVQGADSDSARLQRNFDGFCDMALRLGLVTMIEFVPNRELATFGAALRLVEASKRSNAGICIDPLHWARSGGTVAEIAAAPAGYFPYIQFSDGVLSPGEPDIALSRKLGIGRRVLPGEGTVPLRALLATLPRDVPLSVEFPLTQTEGVSAMPALDWAKLTLERTRQFLATLD